MASWKYTWSSVNIGGVWDPGSQMGEERRVRSQPQWSVAVEAPEVLPLQHPQPYRVVTLQPHDLPCTHCTAHLMVP